MRTLKRSLQILVVAALLALPVAAISAQTGTTVDGYVWDGASDWPGVTQIIVAPEELPQTGTSLSDSYTMDDRALLAVEPWGQEATGEPDLSSMAQTEPGDIYVAASPSAGSPSDPYTMDDRALLAIEPWGEQAPGALPVTGNTGGIYVPPNLPAPGETELTIGEAALSSLAETEPGDIWLSSNPTTSEPAPSTLPETGSSKIVEPAIKEWRFDGFTLVPDFAGATGPEALPETGVEMIYVPDVPSEPPLLLPATPGAAAPEVLPQTGSGEQPGTVSGFVWDGQAYVPDVVSEPPSVLPVTGSGDEAGATIVGFIFDGVTYVPDVAVVPESSGSAAPEGLPQTGATSSGLTGMGTLEERERLETPAEVGASFDAWSGAGSLGEREYLEGAYE